MKFHVLRSLIIPWFVFFIASIVGLVSVGVTLHMEPQFHQPTRWAMGVGIAICLLFNLSTLGKAGIWIAYSLPLSLRTTAHRWILRAVLALALAALFYLVAHASWMPMIWQGAVVPAIFTFALFVALWHVLGPLLRWGSTLPFSRTIVFVLSLPLFATVPVTAMFLGQTIFDAYQASQPDFLVMNPVGGRTPAQIAAETPASEAAAPTTENKTEEVPADKRAQAMREVAEAGKSCPDRSRDIQKNLDASLPEEVVFWSIKAMKCAEMKAVVALPRLVSVMQNHKSHRVRAEAILAMPQYGNENVKQVSYLLVKRLSSQEPLNVIEAAASVLSRLPEDDRKGSVSRLTKLLDDPRTSETAAALLSQKFRQPEVVTEYVSANLSPESSLKIQAISMVCLLPKEGKAEAAAKMDQIIASVKTGTEEDPAMKALECLGAPGFQAIRQEVETPQHMDRVIAARALATMDSKNAPEVLPTVAECSRDKDEQIRRWCSETLGKIGGPALPEILALLKSNDSSLKATGRNALEHFDDQAAKDELLKIRTAHSGWLANQKKIQIARAIDTALVKLEREEEAQSTSANH